MSIVATEVHDQMPKTRQHKSVVPILAFENFSGIGHEGIGIKIF